jgi:hypothetical protein
MAKAKSQVVTQFEQVPLEWVKKVVEREDISSGLRPATCAVCGQPVKLEECKTDEDGAAVHAACYISRIGVAKPAKSRER